MNIELAEIADLFLMINKHKVLISPSGIKQVKRNFLSCELHAYRLLVLIEKLESVSTFSYELLADLVQEIPDRVARINEGICRSDNMLCVMLDLDRDLFFTGPLKKRLVPDAKKGAGLDIVMILERLLTVSEKINTYLGVELMPSCEIKRGRKDLQELKRLITKLQEYVHSIDPAAIISKKKAEIVLINIEAFLTRISIYIATIDYATRIMQDHYELYKEQQRPGSLMKNYLF